MIGITKWRMLMQQAAGGGEVVCYDIEFITSGIHDTNSDGNSFTISGIQEGDFVIVTAASDSQNLDGPSGFTVGQVNNGSNTSTMSGWWYAYSSGNSIDVNDLEGTTGSFAVAWIYQVFRYVHPTSPIHKTVNPQIGSTGDPNPPSITTTEDGCMILAFGMLDDDSVASSVEAPTGFTLIEANDVQYATNMSAYLLQSTSGTIDPAAFYTIGDDNRIGYTVALLPYDCYGLFPRYEQSWNIRTASNNLQTLSISPTDGNYLLAVVLLNDSGNTVYTPSGWTELFQDSSVGTTAVFGKFADNDTSITVELSSTFSDNFVIIVHEFSSVDSTNPYEDLTTIGTQGSQTSISIPSMTSTGTNRLAISIVMRPYSQDTVSVDPVYYSSKNTYSTNVAGDTYSELFAYKHITTGDTPEDSVSFSVSDPAGSLSMLLIPTAGG